MFIKKSKIRIVFQGLFLFVFMLGVIFPTGTVVFADDGSTPSDTPAPITTEVADPQVSSAPAETEASQPAATLAPDTASEPAATETAPGSVTSPETAATAEPAAITAPVSVETTSSADNLPDVIQSLQTNQAELVNKDGNAVPLTSDQAAAALTSPDPWFVDGAITHHYQASCAGFVSTATSDCVESTTPVQAAIDAAPAGSTVHLEAAHFNENVTIAKTVILSGYNGSAFVNMFTLNNGANVAGSMNVFAPIVYVNSGASIQDGIDLVGEGGVVNVAPGNYNETAKDRTINGSGGTYQFGLFIGKDKKGITVRGLKNDGTLPSSNAEATVNLTTNATNNFGPSSIFVEGDNVTISGLKIGNNASGENKTIEIIGDNFNLNNSQILVDGGGSIYFNGWGSPSHIQSYTIQGNYLAKGASIDITNGAGLSGNVANRKIVNNIFDGTGSDWALVSFNGSGTGVPWFVDSVGGAQISGNTFSNGTLYIRARGTYDNSQFDWKSFWDNNIFDRGVVTLNDVADFGVRDYSYTNGYTFNNVRRIGGTIQGDIDTVAQNGDTLLLKGIFPEQLTITKSLTLTGTGAGTTMIKAPVQMQPDIFGAKDIVFINGQGTNVDLSGLTISGPGPSGCGTINFGILVAGGADALIHDNVITSVRDNPLSGCQNGVAIQVGRNSYNTTGQATITNNQIVDYQKNGITIDGRGSSAVIVNNQITGAGPTNRIAQNGIQISRGATATVEGNIVSGNVYTGGSDSSTGILLYEPGNTQVRNNSLSNNDVNLDVLGSGNAYGISGNTLANSIWDGIWLGGTASSTDITNNVFRGNPEGIGVGNGYSNSTLRVTGNSFAQNEVAVYNYTESRSSVTALGNWWGDASGPYDNSAVPDNCGLSLDNHTGLGNSVSQCVIYDKWLSKDPFAPIKPVTAPITSPTNETNGANEVLLTSSIIPVTGGQLTDLSCSSASTIQLPTGEEVVFNNVLCGFKASLVKEDAKSLPGTLPEGSDTGLVNSMTLVVSQDGKSIESFDDGTQATVKFPIPAGMEKKQFSVYRWDPTAKNGSGDWVVVPSGVADGFVSAISNITGTFIVIAK